MMTFIACQVSTKEELDELQKTFAALDNDGNGKLSKDELIKGYKQTMPYKGESEIIKIVEDLM
jgi:calcium-dependent protein kinase